MTRFDLAMQNIYDGQPVIVIDDFERENEGDLLVAGVRARVDNIAFMARYGRGIMCLPSSGAILDHLQIPMMVSRERSTDPFKTPFTVSVDASRNITTGVSASDRVETIKVMVNSNSKSEDLIRPGHLFPLRARDNLLFERRGHTEATVTLLTMLHLYPVGVIVEVMNDDGRGTMARLLDLEHLATEHNLNIISINEIAKEFLT